MYDKLISQNPTLPKIACLYMASGKSIRFGQNKLLYPILGKPMIKHILDTTASIPFTERLLLTIHDEVAILADEMKIPFIKHNLSYRNEVISLGVSTLLTKTTYQGILFCPCDQPFISEDTIRRMLLEFTQNPNVILRLSDGKNPGQPVIFPAALFQELQKLPAKKGGSVLINKYPHLVRDMIINDSLELYDIDTKEDLFKQEKNHLFIL